MNIFSSDMKSRLNDLNIYSLENGDKYLGKKMDLESEKIIISQFDGKYHLSYCSLASRLSYCVVTITLVLLTN